MPGRNPGGSTRTQQEPATELTFLDTTLSCGTRAPPTEIVPGDSSVHILKNGSGNRIVKGWTSNASNQLVLKPDSACQRPPENTQCPSYSSLLPLITPEKRASFPPRSCSYLSESCCSWIPLAAAVFQGSRENLQGRSTAPLTDVGRVSINQVHRSHFKPCKTQC